MASVGVGRHEQFTPNSFRGRLVRRVRGVSSLVVSGERIEVRGETCQILLDEKPSGFHILGNRVRVHDSKSLASQIYSLQN